MKHDFAAPHGFVEGGAIADILTMKNNAGNAGVEVRKITAVQVVNYAYRVFMIAR